MNHPDSTSCSFDGDITQKTNVQLAQGRELQVQNGIDSYLECLIVGVERADLGLVAHVDIPQCLLQPGDQSLPANNIHIASTGDINFTVIFDIGTHTVKGVVQRNGKPIPGAFILLFPAEELSDIRTYIPYQSDLDGSFEFKDLAPGSYGILSIDGGWDLDWQKESVLARYLPGAIRSEERRVGKECRSR